MADLSAISALSSLNERDLYYQYLINNNSTSTMLNALSGNSSNDSDGLSMSGIMNTLGSAYGTSGLTSLLGSALGTSDSGDISSLGTITSFSNILKLYMNSQASEAGTMAEKLSAALEEAKEAGETETNSYKTVQEIYDYFVNKSSMAADALQSQSSSAQSSSVSGVSQTVDVSAAQEFDFDGLEEEIEESISESLVSTGITM